jgi:hypothetical protein
MIWLKSEKPLSLNVLCPWLNEAITVQVGLSAPV